MTRTPRHLPEQFSAQIDGELEGNLARAFARQLDEDPDLAGDYRQFAEVISLLNALPRPEADPDFAQKVHRRIQRRQRSRRRGRRAPSPVPTLGTLSTLVALAVVAGVAVFTHPFAEQISVTAQAPLPLAQDGSARLAAVLEIEPAAAAPLLAEAQRAGLLLELREPGAGAFEVLLTQQQLPALLDHLSVRAALRLQQGPAGPSRGVALQIVIQPTR